MDEQQPSASAGAPEDARRRCLLFGGLDAAAWVVSDPRGGELPSCEVDLDAVINNALAVYR